MANDEPKKERDAVAEFKALLDRWANVIPAGALAQFEEWFNYHSKKVR